MKEKEIFTLGDARKLTAPKAFVTMLRTPKHILLPIIFVLCIVGAFGVNSRVFDTYVVIAFGVIGYLFIKWKLPVAPLIMGFILGEMVETYLRRALMASKGSYLPFVTRPISAVFLAIAVLSIVFSIRKNIKAARKEKE